MIAFFDLEGPLCPIDHAADVIEFIGKKLGKEQDFYQLFQMISLYDDELFLVDKKEDYWPGDTLKLIAPIVVSLTTEKEMIALSKKATLTPGAKELFNFLHKKGVPTYIISTSYTQHAHTIAKKLHHPIENIRCTTLDFTLKPKQTNLLNQLFDEIFPRYLKEGLHKVKKDLDEFFFRKIPQSDFSPIFNSTIVCGGGRKRENVLAILDQHSLQADQTFAVGDSITDVQMLEFVRIQGGTAVSFNGNDHSLKPSSIAYSGTSILPLKELISVFPKTKDFVSSMDDAKKENFAKKEAFFHIVEGIPLEEYDEILKIQLKYRKLLRQRAAGLT